MPQLVPYVFATQTGNIPLSQLDANLNYASGKWISVTDAAFGAKGDGVTDDAAAIQACINAAPDGAIIVLPPCATNLFYRLSTGLSLRANQTLMGLSYGFGTNYGDVELRVDATYAGAVITLLASGGSSGGIKNLTINRAAGSVPVGSIGVLLSSSNFATLENVDVYRCETGFKLDSAVYTRMTRCLTSQITKSHLLCNNAVGVTATSCAFGRNGGLDVGASEYVRIKGACDTIWFTDCLLNESGAGLYVTNGIYFDTYSDANGIVTFNQCHIEHCTNIVGQTGTTSVTRMAFLGTTLSPQTAIFNSLPAAFFSELIMANCPFINGTINFNGFTQMTVTGNVFLGAVTVTGGSGTFSANACNSTLTFTGAFTGFAASGNSLTNGSALTNNGTGFIRVYGTVSNDATNDPAITDSFSAVRAVSFATTPQTVTYSASMTINARSGGIFEITATNATAFTINAPTNPRLGQEILVRIINTSGGALGAATWNAAFKMATWTNPANGNSRSIRFYYNGSNWIEVMRTATDIPN